jgi:molecular chaperone GrpE
MNTDRKHQAPTIAPGQPAAPVAGSTPPTIAPGQPAAPVAGSTPAPAPAPAEREPADSPQLEVAANEPTDDGAPVPCAEPDRDHDAVQQDLEELMARAGKADEYLELAQRTKANFENYRKRATREAAAARDRGMVKLALELLPAVDNLDRALEAADAAAGDGTQDADNGGSPLVSGIRLVHADVIAALARVGIEPFSPVGERFDPQHHEAIAQQPVDGAEPGTVVEVYQPGYRLGDSLLRPARVVVAA